MKNVGIPPGFEKLRAGPGFDVQFGDIYGKTVDGKLVVGFLVMARHLNISGMLHGGALATFADWQIMPVKHQENLSLHTPTISLSVDYFSPVQEGRWLECHAKLQKRTRRMLFTQAEFICDDQVIARSNAIYSLPSQATTAETR